MDSPVPPLKLWLYVLMPLVFGIGGFLAYAHLKYPKPYMVSSGFSESLKNAIAENNAVKPKEKSIVIYGSSLPRYALPFIAEISKKISSQNNKVNILRISISRLNMRQAEGSNFFDYITKFPPDYLFIESNNTNIDNGTELLVGPVSLLYDDLCRNARKLFGMEEPDFNETPPVRRHFYSDQFDVKLFKSIRSTKRSVRSFADNKIANAAYEKLIKQKTKVIFINFPICSRLDSVYLTTDQKNKLQRLLDTYSGTYGIECWNYPNSLDTPYFSDGVHLNYKGAKKYTEWFVSQFNTLK
jgi:hypothetical protein